MTSIENVRASDDNSVQSSPDDDIQDHKPIKSGGVFDNPWNTWQFPRLDRVLQWKLTSTNRSSIPSKSELDKHLPVVTPDFSQQESHPNDVSVTWLGHATVLVRIDGINILTDPVFSERCSPYNYIGPKRFRKSPCSVEDLPNIDAVLISHNHFDHLDTNSVMSLNKRFGAKLHWFVPSGLASWMHETGTENVTELSWWEKDSPVDLQGITFIFTPAQHWCRRGLFDTNKVLWGSWAVKGPKHSFFFAGDTGYCPVFEVIGRRYGPFDIAAIPIGCYEPSWFMKYQHIDPEEAVKIHQEIKARHSVAIHWGTFALAHEFYLDPPKKLEEALQKRKMTEEDFFTLKHGETKVIPEAVNEEVGDDNKNKSNL